MDGRTDGRIEKQPLVDGRKKFLWIDHPLSDMTGAHMGSLPGLKIRTCDRVGLKTPPFNQQREMAGAECAGNFFALSEGKFLMREKWI